MICERITLALNAALDNELSSEERLALDQHLDVCASCHEKWAELQGLDTSLKAALQPRSTDSATDIAINRLMTEISQTVDTTRGHLSDRHRLVPLSKTVRASLAMLPKKRRSARGIVAVLMGMLLLAMGVLIRQPGARLAVAEIMTATGPIDIKWSDAEEWKPLVHATGMSLQAHARVRTSATSLCEIQTTSSAIVRLNHDTEVVLHQAEQVELVTGQFWCRAPNRVGLEVTCSDAKQIPPAAFTFGCSSNSETQWSSTPDQDVRCLVVSDVPVQLKPPRAIRTVEPGEVLTFTSGKIDSELHHSDVLHETSWQLPLLLQRSPQDNELRSRLLRLLAVIGKTKMSYFYEDQIRQLGPAGSVPLLAFVRSIDSLKDPELRHQAMRIVADLAPPSTLPDLEILIHDGDAVVRQFSVHAIRRLLPDPHFDEKR